MSAEPSRVTRPLPELTRVTAANPGPLTLEGTNTYVIGGADVVVLDPGPESSSHADTVVEVVAGRRAVICLTHAHTDHSGAAAELARRLAAPLHASRRTLDRLGLSGSALEDGDRLAALEVLSTPGHSGDHLCFLWHPGRSLFTGDLVLGSGSSLVAHPDGSVADYLASLSRLIAIAPTRLWPGHGPIVDQAVERLREYHEHRLERQRQVEAAVAAGAEGVEAIRRAVYGRLPDPLARAADLSIRAHLEYMADQADREDSTS